MADATALSATLGPGRSSAAVLSRRAAPRWSTRPRGPARLRRSHLLGAARSLLGPQRQRPLDHGRDAAGEAGVALPQRPQRIGPAVDECGRAGQRVRRRRPGQQVVEGRGQGEEVAAGFGALPADLLQRRVAQRVARQALAGGGQVPRRPFGQAEIEQDDLVLVGQLEVVGLDVAMQNRRPLPGR